MAYPGVGRRARSRLAALAWAAGTRLDRRGSHVDWDRADASDVLGCYRLLLGRRPDDRGYRAHLHDVAARRVELGELVGYFVGSVEFRRRMARTFGWSETSRVERELADGSRFFVGADDPAVGTQIRLSGDYEPYVRAAIIGHLQPGSTFVDVGASVGFFSVVAGRHLGSEGKVIAIEPGVQNHPLFLLNVAAANLTNVTLLRVAAGREAGFALYNREGSNGATLRFDLTDAETGVHDVVETRSLDELIAGEDLISVIKVDVEGSEGSALYGAERTLRRHQPTLIFELNGAALEVRSSTTPAELLGYLEHLGYRFEILDPATGPRGTTMAELVELDCRSETSHLDVLAVCHP